MMRLALTFLLVAPALPGAPVEVLLAATEAELQPLLARLTDSRVEKVAAWQFWTGTLAGQPVALTRTEGDPLNAVAATTLALRRFTPKLVVTFGPARAHDPALRPGDAVISDGFAAFDGMISPHRDLGAGSTPLAWHKLAHPLMTPDEREFRQARFPADPAALAVALRTRNPMGRVFPGIIGSAHEVNLELDRVRWSAQIFGMDVEELESGHVAAVAHAYGIRCLAFRVVSDAPYEGVPFIPPAARATAVFTVNFLQNLPVLP